MIPTISYLVTNKPRNVYINVCNVCEDDNVNLSS